MKKCSTSYRVLEVEDDCAVGFSVDEKTRSYLWNEIPASNWTLAKQILNGSKNQAPEPMEVFNVFAQTDNFLGARVDFLSWWRCKFVSNRMRAIFDSFEVSAFYSHATVSLTKGSHVDEINVMIPSIAIDAIDRKESVYSEDIADPPSIRIGRIEKLVLDKRAIQHCEDALFILAGTSQTIWLVRTDLSRALERAKLRGVRIRDIDQCSWEF